MSDVIVVKTFRNRTDAEVAKSALEGNGIQAYIEADDAGGMYPSMSEGIKVLVTKEDEQKAIKILVK